MHISANEFQAEKNKQNLDPVSITSCAQLQTISTTGNYKLANDIDMSECPGFKSIGFIALPDTITDTFRAPACPGGFNGTLDGGNHKIINLNLSDDPHARGVGLFACARGATIKNLTFENVHIEGNDFVGTVSGIVTADFSGNDIVRKSTIDNVHVTGTVNIHAHDSRIDYGFAGGITGYLFATDLLNSSVNTNSRSSEVKAESSKAGGLVGQAQWSNISYSYVDNLNVTSQEETGGLVGVLRPLLDSISPIPSVASNMTNTYAHQVSVNSCTRAGGTVGRALGNSGIFTISDNTTMKYTYTNATVKLQPQEACPGVIDSHGTKIGSVLGFASNSHLDFSSNFANRSNYEDGTPIPPNDACRGNAGCGVYKSDAELRYAFTFSGWDLNNWMIVDGQYPTLRNNPP